MSVFQSKTWVGVILALIVLGIGLTFSSRHSWWCFIDIFFFFMAAFMQLMSLVLAKTGAATTAKLQLIAIVCGILGIVALIGEAIALFVIFQ